MQITKLIGDSLIEQGACLSVAESCTGGLLSAELTSIPGASAWFDRGFIAYSNKAKVECLGVSLNYLEDYGAVSEQVVKAMALGAIQKSDATVALATTGIAGPSGGTKDKPVGLVWFALAYKNEVYTKKAIFTGNRQAIQKNAVALAISWLKECINQAS